VVEVMPSNGVDVELEVQTAEERKGLLEEVLARRVLIGD